MKIHCYLAAIGYLLVLPPNSVVAGQRKKGEVRRAAPENCVHTGLRSV
jgi:hypothetical protein